MQLKKQPNKEIIMLWKKIALILVCISLILGTNALAKSDKSNKVNREKKQKQLPYGLEKKVQRGGELPPGWKNKLNKGDILDERILKQSIVLRQDTYPKEYVDNYSRIYKIEDKIIRVMNATNEILNVLK